MDEKYSQTTVTQKTANLNPQSASENVGQKNNQQNIKNENKNTASVYVGDLPLKTVESDLYKIFNQVGSILTIKLIKPQNDHFSTTYAYITFNNKKEAEEAVNKLNFYKLYEKEIRVMFYDKENIKKNSTGNIVIKNLSPDCDSKTLNDTFSIFGEILSSKVVKNAQGQCKGFGFVQFKKKSSAKKALLVGSEIQMDGFLIKVEKYEKNYKQKVTTPCFTNIFFKNFPLDSSEEKLCDLFRQFGDITSFYFPKKADGGLKGFGFANFNNTDDAQKAIDFLHNQDAFSEECPEPFYVQQAQKKEQRNDLLSAAFEKLSVTGMTYKRNLYVTKLPLTYTKDDVTELFMKWGKVISVMVGKDNLLNEERNWAYVCYSAADEATLAIEQGNETEIEGQKLVISYFKNKSERQNEILHNDSTTRYSFRQEARPNAQMFRGEGGFTGDRSMPSIYRKWQSNTPSNFNKRSYDKKQMSGDLYGLVLSLAPTFSSKWKTLGIKDNEEFASKITNLLLMKSSTDVRNMIALGNVLTQNISEMLNDIQEDTTDLATDLRKRKDQEQ